jgi:hypothetical protein
MESLSNRRKIFRLDVSNCAFAPESTKGVERSRRNSEGFCPHFFADQSHLFVGNVDLKPAGNSPPK